ncbi:unnamed protein product [Spirodela intermedia]|uniref:Uncharacterized protein n=1 Tax=Spirodela intermedia TaxID=51605 RepID=A0A7I8K8E1_SPIIN|nr:unnamed protein product [Spirodela intermedia]
MKGQPGTPQSWSKQQSGYNDMQLYQQQLMYRQLQEFQRQQQFHQLDQEAWQQSSPNQLSSLSKQAALDQLPPVVNGMPVCDAPKYAWQSGSTGCESRTPSSSQMYAAGNMNWTQSVGGTSVHRLSNGVVYPQDQGQVLQSTGHPPQQVDQYLYGTPISGNKTSSNQFSSFQVLSNDGADTMARSVGNQLEKLPMQFSGFNSFHSDQGLFQGQMNVQDDPAVNQRFPGKASFYQLPVHNVRSENMSENFEQLNSLGRSIQVQDFRGSQERADWTGSSREKTAQAGAQELVKLDATEQKLLFSADDDSPWNASFGSGNTDSGAACRNLLDGNNSFNVFPSLQSGSWSALMQSAVAETSSGDTGLQHEWNGLSFQQKEHSSGNGPAMFIDYGKQQTSLIENLQSESSITPRPFPLFDDTDVSSHDQAATMFHQPSFKSVYNRDRELHAEISHQCLQQSSKDANSQVDKSQLHSQFHGGSEPQMHFRDTSAGTWTGQLCEQPASTVPVEARSNPLNMQDTWAQQQNMPSYNIGTQLYNKMNGWRINESSGDAALKVQDLGSPAQQSQASSPTGAMHIRKEHDGNMGKTDGNQKSARISRSTGGFSLGKSEMGIPQVQTGDLHMGTFAGVNLYNSKSTQDMNQRSLTAHQSDYGLHVPSDYSRKSKGNEDVGKYQNTVNNSSQVWESSMNVSTKASAEVYDRRKEKDVQKEVSDEGYISANSHSGEGIDSGFLGRVKASTLFGIPSRPASGSGNASGHIGQSTSGPRRFQFHPMGNLGDNAEPDTPKRNLYAQGTSHMPPHGLKNQDQGYIRPSQFAGRSASNSTRDVEKNSFDSQGNVKGTEKGHPGGNNFSRDSNIPDSFDESAAFLAQNRTGQTSQNMLELLHKVDQSRDTNSIASHGFSNRNMISERSDAASGMPSTSQQPSTLQGMGLHLSLPSQHQSMLSKAVLDHNSRHFDSAVQGEKNQMYPTTSVSVRSLTTMHETPQRETLNNMSHSSEQPGKEISQTTSITSSSPRFFPLDSQQLQQHQQQLSVSSGHFTTEQSVNMPSRNQIDPDVHTKDPSDGRLTNGSLSRDIHGEALANRPSQVLLPGVAGQVAPSRLACPSDTRQAPSTHPYSGDMGLPPATSTSASHPRSSIPGLGVRSVSQPSVRPGVSQQGAFSAMLQNVWTNVSAQRRLPDKPSPNLSQSVRSSPLDTSPWLSNRSDDRGSQKGQSTATCSIDSQHSTVGEQQASKENAVRQILSGRSDISPHGSGATQVGESLPKHSAAGNSSLAIPSFVQLYQQDIGRAKLEQGSHLEKQPSHSSLLNIASSGRDIGSPSHRLKSPDGQHPNYSLLQQVQAMKAIESDPNKRLGKRLKAADSAPDSQEMTGKAPQTLIYGYNAVARVPSYKELNLSGSQSPFPSDTKMLCFSSEASANESVVGPSQVIRKEVQSQVLTGISPNDSQNQPRGLSITSNSSPSAGISPSRIDPQMAPSWFDQYENLKNEQILSTYNSLGDQKTAGAAVQRLSFPNVSSSTDVPSSAGKMNDSDQVESVWRRSLSAAANEHPSPFHTPADAVDHDLIQRPKRHKPLLSERSPWHKEITHESARLPSVSMAEVSWAHTANRLIDKVDDEVDMGEDILYGPRARRRLILTTQLMQLLLPAVPMKILCSDANLHQDSATYLAARLALGRACGGMSSSRRGSTVPSSGADLASERLETSERDGDGFFSKVAEDFIARARKMEGDLSRLESGASVPDVRVECQDLERLSLVNRFVRFHSRGQPGGVESLPTTSEAAAAATPTPRRIYPQRYVAALPMMPGSQPEGVTCLSL